jgi:hypothetical protein
MPRVGKKNFGYTKKGMNQAKKYAKEVGLDIDLAGKKKSVGSSSIKRGMKYKASAKKKKSGMRRGK